MCSHSNYWNSKEIKKRNQKKNKGKKHVREEE